MRTSFSQFESIAKSHKVEIAAHDFYRIQQIGYNNSLPRRIWRIIRGRVWIGWKTYWQAEHPTYGKCFLKVSFGHDTLPREQAYMDAENEVLLASHFADYLGTVNNVRTIIPLDHWKANDAVCSYFITYPWLDGIRNVGLSDYMLQKRNKKTLSNLLRILFAIAAPTWWRQERETHNFACTDYAAGKSVYCNPFNVDFFHNLALDADGQLLFFDLEKYQWSLPGLQEVSLALYLLATRPNLGYEELLTILSHVEIATRQAIMDQSCKVIEKRKEAWKIPGFSENDRNKFMKRILQVPCT